MRILQSLSALAVRQVLGENRADSMLHFLSDRFGDNSQRLQQALQLANERAWQAIEITLAGSSWWQKAKEAVLFKSEDRALKQQIEAFLSAIVVDQPPADQPHFRLRCLEELRQARTARLVPGEPMPSAGQIAQEAAALARFDDQSRLLQAELQAVAAMARELEHRQYPNLARFIGLRPPEGRPILVTAVRYFFRREVENDPKLSAGLTFDQLDSLSHGQQQGFRALDGALREHGLRVQEMLASIGVQLDELRGISEETLDVARTTQEDVRSLQQDLARQQALMQSQLAAVLQLLTQRAAPVPTEALLPAQEATPEAVERLVVLCEQLPEVERTPLAPALEEVRRTAQSVRLTDRRIRRQSRLSAIFLPGDDPSVTNLPVAASPPPPAPHESEKRKVRRSLPSALFRPAPENGEDPSNA
jgi:hypothetical protein